jgi:hypothetical protein
METSVRLSSLNDLKRDLTNPRAPRHDPAKQSTAPGHVSKGRGAGQYRARSRPVTLPTLRFTATPPPDKP